MEPLPLTQQEIEDLFFNDTSKLRNENLAKRRAMAEELKRIGSYYEMGLLWQSFIDEFDGGKIKPHQAITKVVNNHSGVNKGVKTNFLRMLVKHCSSNSTAKSS